MFKVIFFLLTLTAMAQNWPQASGKNLNYQANGNAPTKWSIAEKKNIAWKVALPEGGQSTPAIWNDKLFITINKPVEQGKTDNDTMICMCFDANNGKLLWQKELKGHWSMRMNAIFSDATVCSPITDGKTVCFSSPTGVVAAFDFQGNEKWRYEWKEGGGYNIRQHEPFIIDGKLFMTIERNEPFTVPEKVKSSKKPWQYWGRRKFIRCFNIEDGSIVWDAESDTSPHNTSRVGKTADGKYAIFTARGGGHAPPEKNPGISIIDCATGKDLVTSSEKVETIQNLLFDSKYIYIMGAKGLKLLEAKTAETVKTIPISKALVTEFDGEYTTTKKVFVDKNKKKRGQTEFTNIMAGNYFYFMANTPGFIGRVNVKTEVVEYLQVPLEIDKGKMNWTDHTPPDLMNSRGINVKGDVRSSGNGWGHLGAIPPVIIGENLYFTTMPGTVYVIKWNAKKLDNSALVAVNNLGEPGKTWTLAGFAFAKGKLYTRTLKELICIGN